MKRQPRPGFGTLIRSSAQSSWSGFLLELRRVSTGEATGVSWPVPRVALTVAGQLSVEARALGWHRHFLVRPGSVTIWPGGHELRSLSWAGSCEWLALELDTSTLGQLAQADDHLARLSLAPQLGILDPQLAGLVRAMDEEIDAGCPAGRLYGESLSLALAAYVSGRYSAAGTNLPHAKAGLSSQRLQRVLDYVHAHLGSKLGLVELARVAQLSPHRFCHLFRNSMGLAPHRYVTRERVSAAKRLLAPQRMSIAEVAVTLGFASQSHFTEVFHKVSGITPRRYQQLEY